MISIHILTMVIMLNSSGGVGGDKPASIIHEYNSLDACQKAIETNRQALSSGKVVLATCTKKS